MLIDNTLKAFLNGGSRLSILSGLFSIYAFDALKKGLLKTRSTRLLLTQLNFRRRRDSPTWPTRVQGHQPAAYVKHQPERA